MVIDYVIVTIKNQSLFPSICLMWLEILVNYVIVIKESEYIPFNLFVTINIGYWLCDSYYKESESIPFNLLMWLINIGYWLCDSYYKESESIPFNLFVTDKYWLLIMW